MPVHTPLMVDQNSKSKKTFLADHKSYKSGATSTQIQQYQPPNASEELNEYSIFLLLIVTLTSRNLQKNVPGLLIAL